MLGNEELRENPIELDAEIQQCLASMNALVLKKEQAREEFLLMKAEFDNAKARYFLETKAKNPKFTEKRCEAESIVLAHEARISAIRAESTFKKMEAEYMYLQQRFDSLKERSFNFRATMRSGL